MNLAPWTDLPPNDKDAFSDFQLAHSLAHKRIAEVMYSNSLFYNVFPLADDPEKDRDWLLTHQSEHQSIFDLLDMTGLPDLATVDFKKEDEFQDWMLLHRQVHDNINRALGIV